jgi:hypothetical protein
MLRQAFWTSLAALALIVGGSSPASAQNPCVGGGDTPSAACKQYLEEQKMLVLCEKNPNAQGCAEFLRKQAEKGKQQRAGAKQSGAPGKAQAEKASSSNLAKKPTQGVGFHEVDKPAKDKNRLGIHEVEKPAKDKDRLGFHDVEKPAARGKAAVGFNPQPDPMLKRGVDPHNPNQPGAAGVPNQPGAAGLPAAQLPGLPMGPCPRGANC